MFGAIIKMELKHDTRDLLHRIDEQLKAQGVSYFNKIDNNKLRGYGDAGMGIFEIERKEDADLSYKLFIDANSPTSAEILENIVLITYDAMEEQGYPEELLFGKEQLRTETVANDCTAGNHQFELIKEDNLFDIPVAVYLCSECNKLEMYKYERSESVEKDSK